MCIRLSVRHAEFKTKHDCLCTVHVVTCTHVVTYVVVRQNTWFQRPINKWRTRSFIVFRCKRNHRLFSVQPLSFYIIIIINIDCYYYYCCYRWLIRNTSTFALGCMFVWNIFFFCPMPLFYCKYLHCLADHEVPVRRITRSVRRITVIIVMMFFCLKSIGLPTQQATPLIKNRRFSLFVHIE